MEKASADDADNVDSFNQVLNENWDEVKDVEKIRQSILVILSELKGGDEEDGWKDDDDSGQDDEGDILTEQQELDGAAQQSGFEERTKYIPLRLRSYERKVQRMVNNSLLVCEYTDRVDNLGKKRLHTIMKGVFAVYSGLVRGIDKESGRKLVDAAKNDEVDPKQAVAAAFEVTRRHCLANPELLRGNYAKLVHILQDTQNEMVQEQLGHPMVSPLVTVHKFLADRDGLALLGDPLITQATKEIIPGKRMRAEINAEIREKERAVERLARRYQRDGKLSDDEIRHCLYSIGDNNAYLRSARDPCDEMISYLVDFFSPEEPTTVHESLAIMSGRGGARLTHDHRRQYNYALQTLWLWREVLHDMYKLLIVAECDLLSKTEPYQLRNTGQGLHRLQRSPHLKREMELIVRRVQRRVPNWVGSDVVHLGDHNVPNALTFIDKYAQVPRILLPLSTTLRLLDGIEDDHVLEYINRSFGSVNLAKREILRNFFRHAFDGSGADNFFDAGSCIDGRLTSAWHWCNELEKKRFFPLFQLVGFVGFDSNF